jgi:arsenical pump membrane protein
MTTGVGGLAIWAICALAAGGVLVRPFRTPEAVWAVAGAVLLVVLGLVPLDAAVEAVGKGTDVYLFLIGMMLLSEAAREEGLFDAVAAFAVNRARGSPRRLFVLIYAAGVVVTAFLSNDATAVVLTPAVFAAARRAETDPLPHLFACALVANAASFVLPISNPANLVLYAAHTPPLARWLASFALPSLMAIPATLIALRWAERARLEGRCREAVEQPRITRGGWTALGGLVCTVAVLLTVSSMDRPLGLPTAVMGAATAAVVSLARRASPLPLLRGVAWPVILMVAGLFVLVEGLDRTGLIGAMAQNLARAAQADPNRAAWTAGAALAFVSNLVNNLPAGLMASAASIEAHAPRPVVDALLIGVDLGPNLSVTGSLATLLWLTAIRREGETVGFWRFLKVGAVVMPPALALALAARLFLG